MLETTTDIIFWLRKRAQKWNQTYKRSSGPAKTAASFYAAAYENAAEGIKEKISSKTNSPVTLLDDDGSAFFTASFPLPETHWIYEQDKDGFSPRHTKGIKNYKKLDEHELESRIVAATKCAIRGATNGGREKDFDPDALLINLYNNLFGSEANVQE